MRNSLPIAALLTGALTLTACTDPSTPTNDPNQRAKEGAVIGAISGALLGTAIGDNSKERNRAAVVGAIAGGVAGGLIGQNLDKQARELQASFANGEITVVNTGSELVVTMPQDILFATNSAIVEPALRSDLTVLARSLNDYPDTTVQIAGHTDNTGSAGYNQALSLRRAEAVAAVLDDSGVNPGRIRTVGRGEDNPIATNMTPEGRAQNRRVEIIIRPQA